LHLSDDRAQLSTKEQQQVAETLKTMASKYGYCEHCGKDSLVFLMRKRYAA
jgi:RNA polymerase-binding transcription factor DksA